MASPTITFPCPFCGRRMGVTAEFLGRQVRCPHCKQVVLAPTGSAPAPAPVAPQPVPTPAPSVPRPASNPGPVIQIVSPPNPQPVAAPAPPEPELPVFNIPQRKEGADSILSEPDESEDEVFGSHPGMRLGALPPLETIPSQPGGASHEATQSERRTTTGAATPPTPLPPVPPAAPKGSPAASPGSQLPPTTGPNPLADLEPVSLPSAFVQPVPVPQAPQPVAVQPAPAPAPTVPSNPFANFGDPASAPAAPREEADDERPRNKKKRDRDERDNREERERERDERPARAGHARPAAPGGGGGVMVVLLILLTGYALLATAAAVYGLFFRGDQPDTGHPLSTIPDNFGEFDPASRKKVSQYKFKVDGELPADQRAGLGEKVTIGQLEIQPVRIEKRRLVIKTESAREALQSATRSPALVLTLAIRNTSSDLYIHPMDPAFTRKAVGYDTPITRLVVNKDTVFAGGEIPWPLSGNVKRQLEVQQANDYVPLKPGERREYVVFTSAELNVVRAVDAAKEPMQWRVQVRRGPVEYKGKEIPVTAVIGVDFKASEITTPD